MYPSTRRKRSTTARLRLERLEDRRVLAGWGHELPSTAPISAAGERVADLASHVVQQVQSRAAALLGSQAPPAPNILPDVDGKDGVTSFDALLVINDLNRHGTRLLQAHETAPMCVDVDRDGWVTPFDALTVVNTVNYLHRQRHSPAAAVQPLVDTSELVIQQTQAVHDQIADLLNQLRNLQDLQVTIEVRFITLDDNFFERIGVDFDFDINDPTLPLPGEQVFADGAPGVNEVGSFEETFNRRGIPDLNFNQDAFVIAPPFGGSQIDAGANFGFAILSDIEVFFFLQASQGDDRSDVIQAPKVTLFNGQTATVFSNTQRPFVTSVIPVVG